MKKSFILSSATILFALTLFATPARAVTVGEPAPAFTGTDIAGKTISLADFKGKLVVLEWMNSECPFVKKHYSGGNMQKLQQEAAAKGIVWLSVNSTGKDKKGYLDGAATTAWLKEQNAAPAHLLLDDEGTIGHLYDAKTTPHMFIINKDGILAYAGAIDSVASAESADVAKADNYVRNALNELEAGKPVTLSSTTSYGCGVKYSQ